MSMKTIQYYDNSVKISFPLSILVFFIHNLCFNLFSMIINFNDDFWIFSVHKNEKLT